MRRRILKEGKEDSSVKEFLSFISTVKKEGLFQGVQWELSDGHASRYLPFDIFISELTKQIREKEKTDSPITNYWIWKIGPFVKGIDSSEIDKAIEGGLKGVLELGRDNKDIEFGKIGTNFTSKDKEEFAKAMSKGEFGSLDENELANLGDELADLIKKEVGEEEKELKEILDPISILSTVLASTTLVNIIAKYAGKLFKKYNIEKGEKGAKKIYDFTHKLEEDFKSPIKRVVKLFTKDEKTINIVTNSLYALVILTLGVKAGGGAIQSIDKGNLASGSVSSLKAALKGKDLASLVKTIVKSVT